MSNGNKGNRMKAMYSIKLPKSGDTHEELNAENVNQERLNENFSTLSKEVVKLWDNSDKGFDSLSARLTSDEEVFITADDAEDIAVYEIENSAVIAALPTEILTQVSRTYETKTDAADKLDAAKDYTDSELVDYSTTSQTADMISQSVAHKVGDDEIISKINQSAEQISIQANKVNLTGYVTATDLSTSGSTVINGSNIATGSVALSTLTAAAQGGLVAGSSTKTQYYLSTSSSSATGGSWSDTVPTWSSGKYVWTREATTVTFASGGTSTGYSTAVYDSNLTTALSTAASASSAASTAQTTANGANAQEQLIYISKPSGTTTVSANTTWVTNTTGNQNTWTLKRPEYNSSYPVLFVATQRKAVDGTVTCTTPMIDLTTTVIDGGHITTGTIDASVVSVTNLNASNITSGTMTADKISGGMMTVGGQNDTNGYIRILDSTGNYAGGIGSGGITVKGEEPSAQSHVCYNNVFPEGISIYDDTTSKSMANITTYVADSTDEYASVYLHGYDNGTDVSSAQLSAYPYNSGAYLLLKGPGGAITRLNSDGTYAGDLTLTGGNLTVGSALGGVLDVVDRRCYATLSSDGWYRVLKTADVSGTIIDIYIGRPYGANPAETHKISFFIAGGGKSTFTNEISATNTLCVDKIRYTYGGGFAYVDIHYNANSANEVLVYFDVYGKGQANGTTVAYGLQNVGPSPSGETVSTPHNFIANNTPVTVTDSSNLLTSGTIASSGSMSYTATVPCWVYLMFIMQANSSGSINVQIDNVNIINWSSGEAVPVNFSFLPIPLMTGNTLYVAQSSNRASTYSIFAMR